MSLFLEDEVWLDEFLFGEELESAGAPLDAGELQQRWCVPVVSAVRACGDWLLDWSQVRHLWVSGAYFVLLLAGAHYWCLPDPVLRDLCAGMPTDTWVSIDRDGLLVGDRGYAELISFQQCSPREVMAFLESTRTRSGDRRKRAPDYSFKIWK